MKIRTIKRADLPLLAKMNAKIFKGKPSLSLAAFRHSFSMGVPGASLVAEEDGKIAGAIFAEKKITFLPKTAHIASLFIAEGFRGKGLGTILLKRSLAALRARGCKSVSLTVDGEKCPAYKLYSKMGFKKFRLLMLREF